MPLIDNYLLDGPSASMGIGEGLMYRQSLSLLQTTSPTPVELIGVRINKIGGKLKVRTNIRREVTSTSVVNIRVYVNDKAYSSAFSTSDSSFLLCEADISFNAGDKISLYGWSSGSGRLHVSGTVFVSDFMAVEREQNGPN